MASYDVRFQAPLVSPATPVTAGQVMCETTPASGVVTIATAAALLAAGRPLGVALISSNGVGSIDLQYTGPLLAPGFTLGAGAAGPVGIDPNGNLIRGVQSNGWNVGYCTAAGLVTLRDLSVAGSAFVNSPTGTGVALVSGGSFVAAAGPVPLGGGSSYVSGLLPLANVTPGTNGQVLGVVAGVAAWVAATTVAITALTGDVTATGPGSVTATVAQIHGATVPAAGALTTGNVLQVSGVSALSYAPVNLAGGAGYVTGTLPTANQAAQTMVGDCSGTTAACVVNSAGTGAVGFANGTTGTGLVTWAAGTTTPGLTQTTAATASTIPVNFTITPQAPNAGASATGPGTPGSLVVALAAPVSTGATPYLGVSQGGTIQVSMGGYPGGGYSGIWFGNAAGAAATATNYSLIGNPGGTYTFLNVPSVTGTVTIRAASAVLANFDANQGALCIPSAMGMQVGNTTTAFGGGAGVIGIANATTQPTSLPSGGLVLSSTAASLGITGQGIIFSQYNTTNVGLSQANSATTGTATAMLVQAQGTTGSAGTGGQLTVAGGDCSSVSATVGGILLLRGGNVSGTGGAVAINTGTGNTANGMLTVSSGQGGVTYNGSGVVTAGTPGVWLFKGGSLASVTYAAWSTAAANIYKFPIQLNGVTTNLLASS